MKNLIDSILLDSSMEHLQVMRKGKPTDVSLINQFQRHEFIPNKWFDWENRVNAPIMVIGQDWGPYSVLEKFIADFDYNQKDDDDYYLEYIFRSFTSRTEKFILAATEDGYEKKYQRKFSQDKWNEIFLTMSVIFTRQGILFRGNDFFDPKQSFDISYKYVAKQIDIVKPKVIMPLGNMAFDVVNKYYNLGYKKPQISKVIKNLKEDSAIYVDGTNIIPNFHPAAHVDPAIAKSIWYKIWDFVEI